MDHTSRQMLWAPFICSTFGAPSNIASAFLCRDAFVAPEGRVLLSADYAQMELRLMAHLSGDEALCAMLRDPSQDPFTLWASQWMLIPASQASAAD